MACKCYCAGVHTLTNKIYSPVLHSQLWQMFAASSLPTQFPNPLNSAWEFLGIKSTHLLLHPYMFLLIWGPSFICLHVRHLARPHLLLLWLIGTVYRCCAGPRELTLSHHCLLSQSILIINASPGIEFKGWLSDLTLLGWPKYNDRYL